MNGKWFQSNCFGWAGWWWQLENDFKLDKKKYRKVQRDNQTVGKTWPVSVGCNYVWYRPSPAPATQSKFRERRWWRPEFRVPRRHLLVEQTSARENRERINPQICEYCRPHLAARRDAKRFLAALASVPSSPSTEYTRGVKVLCACRHACPYLAFLSFSCFASTLAGAVFWNEAASVSVC